VDQVTGFKNEGQDMGQLVRRAWGYLPNEAIEEGMAEVVDGTNVLAVHDVYRRTAAHLRAGRGPSFVLFEVMRYVGHSLSDDTASYRRPEESDAWKARDAIAGFEEALISAGVATSEQLAEKRRTVARTLIESAKQANEAPKPAVTALLDNVFASGPDPERDSIPRITDPKDSPSSRVLSFREAIREAIAQLFEHDPRTYYWGEDVAEYGGAFGVTGDLKERFPDRIWNTGISENAIVGAGLGAALTGLKPMVEIMYGDFLAHAQDQIANQAALNRFMYGGNRTPGFVTVTTIGGGKSYACQHGKEVVSQYILPGLRVAVPSNPFDAKGLLVGALYSGDPAIYFEHQLLLENKGPVPQELYYIPLGVANVVQEGSDVTLWAYGKMVDEAVHAARHLKSLGVQAEVIDPRTLSPMDYETVKRSVEKTGALVLASQGTDTGNVVHTLASKLARMVQGPFAFETVTAPDGIIPTAENLERAYLPNQLRIVEKACALRGMSPAEIREAFPRLYERYERA
jgi:pyruvate/2-oxoglutarate/acetoin dehydrogenase E1 component